MTHGRITGGVGGRPRRSLRVDGAVELVELFGVVLHTQSQSVSSPQSVCPPLQQRIKIVHSPQSLTRCCARVVRGAWIVAYESESTLRRGLPCPGRACCTCTCTPRGIGAPAACSGGQAAGGTRRGCGKPGQRCSGRRVPRHPRRPSRPPCGRLSRRAPWRAASCHPSGTAGRCRPGSSRTCGSTEEAEGGDKLAGTRGATS